MIEDKFSNNLIETALDSGADSAEVFISERKETEITIANERPESVNVKSESGFGIRVLVDSKLGFYSSNKANMMEAIEKVRQLVNATALHTPDPFNVIPDKFEKQPVEVKEMYDPEMVNVPLDRKIKAASEIEKYGKSLDPKVAGFVWTLYGDIAETYRVLNSSGIDISSTGTICYGFGYCYASNGQTAQTGRFAKAYGKFDQFSSELIGKKAAEYALRALGSEDYPGGTVPAVFPPEAGVALIYSLFGMIEADSVQKGKSPFRDKIGQKIASEIVNVIDDGTMIGGLASRPYDSEGVPTTKTSIIENGVLKSYLYDSYTARKGKVKSTGNASRPGYHGKPSIHPTNFFLQVGTVDSTDIIKKIQNGIMITELSGLHAGINYATADFSVPARGILIKDGKLAEPVNNISISGNLFDFLKNISEIADDLEWEPMDGMIGAPTFMVDNLKVVGKER